MNLYRHYKNKNYKYIGIVKHSETLEELALYDCLYENPEGKTWVRPKKMFFESIEHNGNKRPRFEQIPIQIKSTTELTEDKTDIVTQLSTVIFKSWDNTWFLNRLKNKSQFHLGIAFIDNLPVGYKMGYAEDDSTFYSWVGGVLPQYQGLGIAKALMDEQHKWCKQHNFYRIQTKTQNEFKSMLLLNIKQGFNIIGTSTSGNKGLKIIMEKTL